MSAILILNPYANRGRAVQRIADIHQALKAHGVAYELVETQKPRHAVQLAREAVEAGFQPILAAGGDGLINEVINGIGSARGAEPWPALGVFRMGTANDLADNVGLPGDPMTTAAEIAAGHTRPLDICKVNDRYFMNNSGLGLESYVSVIQNRLHRVRGNARYLLATFRGIADNPQWDMRLTWDTGTYEGPVTMVSVGNSPRTGGIFYTVPHANPFDGLLTFVYGYMGTRLQILRLLPRTMRPEAGNYVEHPAVHETHTRSLQISLDAPSPLHADGEIIAEGIREAQYEVLPGQLPLLMAA